METSSSRPLKLVLATVAMLLALVIAFYIGRATAPTNSGSELPSSIDQADSDSSATPDSAALAPNQPTYSESQTDENLVRLLTEQPRRDADDPRALGDVNAPVVMVAYEDFSCPMCTKFFLETYPHLKEYVDAGKLRIEFHDLVIFPNYGSNFAAHGSRAAAEQGKFWEFVETAYRVAGAGNHPQYTAESVVEIAEKAGVPDLEKFRETMDSPETAEAVNAESAHAMQKVGIQGTPFFIVNKAVITGALPVEYMTNTIDKQLEEAGQ
ncbi:MAG: thioredoxin domain-containing protein [Actinomycetaceae bacterium]|nr:thioredoxin domain-containing protein [Actinomycetaceae bacterium]